MLATNQYFLRIADAPCEILDVAVCLDNAWGELDTEP